MLKLFNYIFVYITKQVRKTCRVETKALVSPETNQNRELIAQLLITSILLRLDKYTAHLHGLS